MILHHPTEGINKMRATARIDSLQDSGDRITVKCIGEFPVEGEAWRHTRSFSLDMPTRLGSKLCIGQHLTIEIKPGKKP